MSVAAAAAAAVAGAASAAAAARAHNNTGNSQLNVVVLPRNAVNLLGFDSASCNASNWRASFSGYSGSV